MMDRPTTERPGIRVGAGVIALGALLLLLVAVGVAVALELRGGGSGDAAEFVTIAELRADPGGFDNRSVQLRVWVEDVRSVPLLSQYAVYNVRDATGSMRVLTSNGAPPSGDIDDPADAPVELQALFHSRITLNDELKRIIADQLGALAGAAAGVLLPGIPLDVIFLQHEHFETTSIDTGTPGR